MSSPIPQRTVRTGLSTLLALSCACGFAEQAAAAAPSRAAGGTDWQKIASCESGGRWRINTGNGYYGGLQMSRATWRTYGGADYAPRPDLATREEQIAVGEKIVRARGLSPWPTCGRLGRGTSHSDQDTDQDGADDQDSAATEHHSHEGPSGSRSTADTWTVRSGDRLSDLAQRFGVPGGWPALYELNKDALHQGPDRIRPGQVLRLRE